MFSSCGRALLAARSTRSNFQGYDSSSLLQPCGLHRQHNYRHVFFDDRESLKCCVFFVARSFRLHGIAESMLDLRGRSGELRERSESPWVSPDVIFALYNVHGGSGMHVSHVHRSSKFRTALDAGTVLQPKNTTSLSSKKDMSISPTWYPPGSSQHEN